MGMYLHKMCRCGKYLKYSWISLTSIHIFALTLTDPAPKLMYDMMLSILVTRDFYKSTLNYQIKLQYYICVVCDLI